MTENDGGAQHGRDVLTEVLIREAVGLAVVLAVCWVMGPGRVLVPAWIARAKALLAGRDPHEAQVRQFGSEVSRWDHEQAAQQDRKAAGGGPCGCG